MTPLRGRGRHQARGAGLLKSHQLPPQRPLRGCTRVHALTTGALGAGDPRHKETGLLRPALPPHHVTAHHVTSIRWCYNNGQAASRWIELRHDVPIVREGSLGATLEADSFSSPASRESSQPTHKPDPRWGKKGQASGQGLETGPPCTRVASSPSGSTRGSTAPPRGRLKNGSIT